jgi:hypothetical protein
MKYLALTVVLLALLLAATAQAMDTDKLKVSLNMSTRDTDDDTETTYNWALDGKWHAKQPGGVFSLQVDSDYEKDDSDSEFDRLKTWWRYTWNDAPATEWRPVALISTEGDHGADSLYTLGAFGYSKDYNWGTLEFTFGASKDVRTAEPWIGDIGAYFDYSKSWGRMTLGVQPGGELGVLGEVRQRDDDFRYSVDGSLDYAIAGHLKGSYRVHFNNTSDESDHHQFLGITYER